MNYFRAWDKKRNKWASEVNYLNDSFQSESYETEYGESITIGSDLEIMKYIGIEDENSKMIYEGDIIERTDIKFVAGHCVKIIKDATSFLLEMASSQNIYKYDHENKMIKNFKIIGNIYEKFNKGD